jgi:hypothetical protein
VACVLLCLYVLPLQWQLTDKVTLLRWGVCCPAIAAAELIGMVAEPELE